MSAFKKLISMNIKSCMQYKLGFLMSLIIQPFVLLINYALFKSIYAYNDTNSIKGYNLMQIVWYYQAINFVFVFIWNWVHTNISSKVLNGDLVMDLLRPVSLFKLELADAIGQRIVGVLLEFLPAIVIYSLIIFPTFVTIYSMIRFFVVIFFAFFLYYAFGFTVSLIVFAVKNSTTVTAVKEIIAAALGGAYIPLEYFPAGFNRFLDFLPFKYIFYWPGSILFEYENDAELEFLF